MKGRRAEIELAPVTPWAIRQGPRRARAAKVIVDTSAVMTILFGESEAERYDKADRPFHQPAGSSREVQIAGPNERPWRLGVGASLCESSSTRSRGLCRTSLARPRADSTEADPAFAELYARLWASMKAAAMAIMESDEQRTETCDELGSLRTTSAGRTSIGAEGV